LDHEVITDIYRAIKKSVCTW